jgi:hypothetical protein
MLHHSIWPGEIWFAARLRHAMRRLNGCRRNGRVNVRGRKSFDPLLGSTWSVASRSALKKSCTQPDHVHRRQLRQHPPRQPEVE